MIGFETACPARQAYRKAAAFYWRAAWAHSGAYRRRYLWQAVIFAVRGI